MAKKLKPEMGSRITINMNMFNGMQGGLGRGRNVNSTRQNKDDDAHVIEYLPQENVQVRFWFHGYLFWVNNHAEKISHPEGGGGQFRRIVLTTFLGGKDLITRLIEEAKEQYAMPSRRYL